MIAGKTRRGKVKEKKRIDDKIAGTGAEMYTGSQ
jgi:hypothetical protein